MIRSTPERASADFSTGLQLQRQAGHSLRPTCLEYDRTRFNCLQSPNATPAGTHRALSPTRGSCSHPRALPVCPPRQIAGWRVPAPAAHNASDFRGPYAASLTRLILAFSSCDPWWRWPRDVIRQLLQRKSRAVSDSLSDPLRAYASPELPEVAALGAVLRRPETFTVGLGASEVGKVCTSSACLTPRIGQYRAWSNPQ